MAIAVLPHKVETLALSSKSFPLPTVSSKFPTSFVNTGGAVQGGRVPLVCGGHVHKRGKSASCYRYSMKGNAWVESGKMSEAKSHLASSIHPELGLVITGGHIHGNRRSSAVESTKDGKHFSRQLPNLPVAVHAHCQVTVDPNTIMVFGGCTAHGCSSNMALKLNIRERKWKKLPSMPTGRHGPGCGVVSEKGVPKRVIVTGGHVHQRIGKGPHRITNRVEILELSTLTWSMGSPLPQRLHFHAGIQYHDTFFLAGGHEGRRAVNTVYRYEPRSGHWELLPYRMSRPAHAMAAFPVSRKAFKNPK